MIGLIHQHSKNGDLSNYAKYQRVLGLNGRSFPRNQLSIILPLIDNSYDSVLCLQIHFNALVFPQKSPVFNVKLG